MPHSTLGYERRFNWAFTAKSEADFVASVLTGQPDPPRYFATMKRLNKEGRAARRTTRSRDSSRTTRLRHRRQRRLVIDTRPAADLPAGHVPGTLNIPLNGSFVTWAGWLVPYDRGFHLIVDDGGDGGSMKCGARWRSSASIASPATSPPPPSRARGGTETINQMAVDELARRQRRMGSCLIDVRHDNEWSEGHIPNAIHIPLGQLAERINEIPVDRQDRRALSGRRRSSIAASLLQKLGRKNVANLTADTRPGLNL